jgi:hypothetical protein
MPAPSTLQRLSRPAKIISHGNSVEIPITWRDMRGLAATPLSVQYQVFDALTGANVSPLVTVDDSASSMEIRVPGSHLPVGGLPERLLVIQLQAEFETADDVHTEFIEILVKKVFTFTN